MYNTQIDDNGQLSFDFSNEESLIIPSSLIGFHNTNTIVEKKDNHEDVYHFVGTMNYLDVPCCEKCNSLMHVNKHKEIVLKHIPIGMNKSCVHTPTIQYRCSQCGHTSMATIPFKASNHLITKHVENYIIDLLERGTYTLKEVAYLSGVNKNIVKDIDLCRLKEKYTIDGKILIKPEQQARYIGIDEFKLHNGYKYATHIIDLETGHILWIQEGKKKQVVYDFIKHVGQEWIDNVEAVACDMNSDFQEAFEEKCPYIQVVFDYFHIVKNFNEKVISPIRIEEEKRLKNEGKTDEAKSLKHSKYILTSSKETLTKKDKEAQEEKVISKGSELFNKAEYIRKGGNCDLYEKIISENELLFKCDYIKEKLRYAYGLTNEDEMVDTINDIITLCSQSGNRHLQWFERLLLNHFEGIIAHATIKISSGKIEGINNKIKTLRRQAYGLPDDEYFFLKLFDVSRTKSKIS